MEPLEPVTGRLEHGRTGAYKINFGNKKGTGVGLCSTQRVEKKEGRGTKATSRLDNQGGSGVLTPGVVLTLSPFVRGCLVLYSRTPAEVRKPETNF
jgi:hypothetical protein